MKVSELIARLQHVLAERGDIEVTCFPYDGQMGGVAVESVDVCDKRAVSWDNEKTDWVWEDVPPFVLID